TEITGMVVSFVVAIYFQFIHTALGFEPILAEVQMVLGVAITTVAWLAVTLLTPADNMPKLIEFYQRVRPGGPGWRRVVEEASAQGIEIDSGAPWTVPQGILCMLAGT